MSACFHKLHSNNLYYFNRNYFSFKLESDIAKASILVIVLIFAFNVKASVLATVTPSLTPVKLPGPFITIIKDKSLVFIFNSFKESSIVGIRIVL